MKHVGRHSFRTYSIGSRRKKLVKLCEKCGKPAPKDK